MKLTSRASRGLIAGVALALPLAGCGGGDRPAASSSPAPQGDCPVAPVNVVVSVDQWGDLVSQLGGDCAKVTTVLASSSVDPHDYEPAPSDAAEFEGAQLVVVNGGHYDEWASKLAQSSAPQAPVIDAVQLATGHAGDGGHEHVEAGNPHVWYSPAVVQDVMGAVTDELGKLAPDAVGYFTERRAELINVMAPYTLTIQAVRGGAAGRTFAATEGVFDDMADALGLQNRTPEGYRRATANESEPAPGDLDAFLTLLRNRGVDVLIYNTQTEGSAPEQIRAAAQQAGVPVVDVTETVPPGTTSFMGWQTGQLDALAKVFGVPV